MKDSYLLHGGSWLRTNPIDCKSAYCGCSDRRCGFYYDVGFRLVRKKEKVNE